MRARVHRLAWIVLAVAAAVAAFAPIVLGPAMPFVARALGGEAEHRCACGMKAGKCACPECARLEQARRHDAERRSPVPVLKTSCDGDDAVVLGQVPPAVLAAPVAPLPLRATDDARSVPRAGPPRDVFVAPPTPPPRTARA